jgi:hypothetical protein
MPRSKLRFSEQIAGHCFCLKKTHQTRNPHNTYKSTNIIYKMKTYIYIYMYMYIITLRTALSKHNNVANATFETSKFSRQIPGKCFCLKKAYQTQNPHKSNKFTRISRHVFNSKRRTKCIQPQEPVIPGKCFCL